MKIEEIQSYAVAQILADATLAALGTPLSFSYFTDDEEAVKAIETALREKGAIIQIDLPAATGDNAKPQDRYCVMEASFSVFVAESPKVSHAPTGTPLASLVAKAIQARSTPASPAIRCTNYDHAQNDNGNVLHVLTFSLSAFL